MSMRRCSDARRAPAKTAGRSYRCNGVRRLLARGLSHCPAVITVMRLQRSPASGIVKLQSLAATTRAQRAFPSRGLAVPW